MLKTQGKWHMGGRGAGGDAQRGGGRGRSGQSPWDRPAAVDGKAFAAVPGGRRGAVQPAPYGRSKALPEIKPCESRDGVSAVF